MKKYIQADITVNSQNEKDLLIAELSVLGFEGFEEERTNLKAFINEPEFDETAFKLLLERWGLKFTISIIEDKNWNAIWESGFEPVIVGDFCAIRADFHAPVSGVAHEIIITPKMSFGTGHHATTYMMIDEMQRIDFTHKNVFDFGTGTGVLAILAEQLGAARVVAADNDDWSIENAKENLLSNNSSKTIIVKLDTIAGAEKNDVILANINKHVILEQMKAISENLVAGGTVLFSGLLADDEEEVDATAKKNGLDLIIKKEQHNWICLRYVSNT